MTTSGRFMVHVATGLAAVLVVTLASALGMPMGRLVLVAVVTYTACFTAQDWFLKEHGPDRAAFLRRSITSNLILVSIIAALLYAVLLREPSV